MQDFIMTLALGILICVMGAVNMTGNISTLHRYHRKRVTEENRKPFGRLVGLGTLIVGVGLIIFSIFNFTKIGALTIVGIVLLITSIVVGMGLNFYAMFKYNKGIF